MGGDFRFEQRTLNIMRIIGLLTPLFLLGYGIFIILSVVASKNYINDIIFWSIVIPWNLLGLHQYVFPAQTKRHMLINITLYHLFAVLYILLVSGFTLPFLSAWALLYLASYVYFANLGVAFSVICFLIMMVIDIILYPSHSVDAPFTIMSCISTLLVGVAAISLNRIKEYDREAILRSKRSELLQRDRIATLVNNLADAIISTDSDGYIQLYNAAALDLLDTNTQLDGQLLDSVLELQTLGGESRKLLPLLLKSRTVTIDDSLVAHIGDERLRLEITYSPIRSTFAGSTASSRDDGYVIIIRDITKTKSLEEERDEFISVVSHELRTPIAITEGAIDNAQVVARRDDTDKTAITKNLALAHEQIMFLSRMVNDLSTLSRAERNVADTAEEIDVAELAHSLHTQYSPEATKKGLTLNLLLDPHLGSVMASRLYLHELLQNFITNAIKYTKEGKVELIITTKGQTVTFAVRDTGIGISKSDQAKIFQKFYRSEDYRTRETGGTGLGLYVAVKLAKKLQTTIDVKSRLNHGSTFSFSLPLIGSKAQSDKDK